MRNVILLGGAGFSPLSLQFFNRLATQPTAERKTLYAALIDGLNEADLWSKLDALYMLAAADEATALTNLIQNNYAATKVGTPTFSADDGYAGSADNYLNTNFNPTTAVSPHFTQDDACVFAWGLKSAADAGGLVGTTDSGAGVESAAIFGRFTDNQSYLKINSGSITSVASADGAGLWTGSRRASNVMEFYRNGSSIATSADVSATPNNSDIFILRRGTSFYGGTVTCAGFGEQISDAESATLYDLLLAYLQGVGAVA